MSSGDIRIDAVVREEDRINRFDGAIGTPVEVTYSFMAEAPSSGSYRFDNINGFKAFNEAQKLAVRFALNEYEQTSGLTFQLTDDAGILQLGFYTGRDGIPSHIESSAEALTNWRNDTQPAADVWLNHTQEENITFTPGEGYGYFLLLHEIGHTLGLKHPVEYTGYETPPYLAPEDDNGKNTIMSYQQNDLSDVSLGDYDLLALDYLYGPNNSSSDYALSASHLAALGVTIDAAYDFLADNVNRPDKIAETAMAHELTLAMLAEIIGYEADSLDAYFAEAGINWPKPSAAQQHLEARGISLTDAQAFVTAHLDSPNVIYQTVTANDVNADMLANIVGVQRHEVDDYFSSHGLSLA